MKKLFYTPAAIMLIGIILLTGCTVNRKLSFENKEAGPEYKTTKTALIVFQEKREEVLAGKEKTSFCGHSNSSAGISYNIQTESGRPLADEFAGSVTNAFNRSGAVANTLLVNMNTGVDSVIQVFKTTDKDRLLFFTVRKWESRATPLFTTIRYELIYQLELKVYNKTGELIATNKVQDVFVKEQGAATNMKRMQEMADDIFKEQVKLLLSSEEVKNTVL